MPQLQEICLELEALALKELGNNVETALNKDATAAAEVIYLAMKSCGITPFVPGEQDDDAESTMSGHSHSSQVEQQPELTPEEEAALERELALQKEAEAVARAARAEEKRKRDELHKKEQAQAEAKRRQQEKKEAEKAKKAEEKRLREEDEADVKRQQAKDLQRQHFLEQAEKERLNEIERREEREANIFSEDRRKRLERLENMQPNEPEGGLATLLAVEADGAGEALRGALLQTRENAGAADFEILLDRVAALLLDKEPIWALCLLPPSNLKPSAEVRNRSKKARLRLREVLGAWFTNVNLAGADSSNASEYQRSVVEGTATYTWQPAEESKKLVAAEPPTSSSGVQPKKGKKGGKGPKEEEDLDALLKEAGLAPAPAAKKSGKKKR
eukprot:NODE_2193_length_2269_cov_5.719888.p1 GENE.NODE_2193_length_2269_cov_5.719888~~NODE_2193_length_2269_cov_5.719888.p1  ORF type:complete len:388 (+),score=153.19 NODE_2193_length_2269_cov_5.719888:758-1921(+)